MMPRLPPVLLTGLALGATGSLALGAGAWGPAPLLASAMFLTAWGARVGRADRSLAGLRTGSARSRIGRWLPSMRAIVVTGIFVAPIGLGYVLRLHHFTYGPLKFETDERTTALVAGTALLLLLYLGAPALFELLPAVLARLTGNPRAGSLVAPLLLALALGRWAWGGPSADRGPALARFALLALVLLAATTLARRDLGTGGASGLFATYLLLTLFGAGDPDALHPSIAQLVGGPASWGLRIGGAALALVVAVWLGRDRPGEGAAGTAA